jgi:flavin reductase (NADH)
MSRPAETEGSVDADRFREMMSRFPTGVSVITAADRAGTPHGATCSSLSSVTLVPPTLLVCLQVDGATVSAIQATRRFVVNLLRYDSRRVAKIFASPGADRFAEVEWQALSSSGLPYLHRDAFAVADCGVTHELVIGDHVVMAGVPSGIWLSPGVPLLYGSRRFASWAPDHSLPEGMTT